MDRCLQKSTCIKIHRTYVELYPIPLPTEKLGWVIGNSHFPPGCPGCRRVRSWDMTGDGTSEFVARNI